MKRVLGYVVKPKEETIKQMLEWYTNLCDLPKSRSSVRRAVQEIEENYKKQPISKYRIILEKIK